MKKQLFRHRTPRRLFTEGLNTTVISDPISLVNDINKSTVISITCHAKGCVILNEPVKRPKATFFSSSAISIEAEKLNVTITYISKVERWQSGSDSYDITTKGGTVFRIAILKY